MSRSKRVDRTESSKEPDPVPSTSGVSETAACPPSLIADDPSALPSPTLFLFRSVTLLACSLDATPCITSCCTVLLYFSRYCKIKNVFSVFVSLCIIYMQSIINLLQYRQFCQFSTQANFIRLTNTLTEWNLFICYISISSSSSHQPVS